MQFVAKRCWEFGKKQFISNIKQKIKMFIYFIKYLLNWSYCEICFQNKLLMVSKIKPSNPELCTLSAGLFENPSTHRSCDRKIDRANFFRLFSPLFFLSYTLLHSIPSIRRRCSTKQEVGLGRGFMIRFFFSPFFFCFFYFYFHPLSYSERFLL